MQKKFLISETKNVRKNIFRQNRRKNIYLFKQNQFSVINVYIKVKKVFFLKLNKKHYDLFDSKDNQLLLTFKNIYVFLKFKFKDLTWFFKSISKRDKKNN